MSTARCESTRVAIPEAGAVLAITPSFVLDAAVAQSIGKLSARLVVVTVFLRVEIGKVLAHNFLLLVALEALCAGIPSGYMAGGVEHEDSIVLDCLDEDAERLIRVQTLLELELLLVLCSDVFEFHLEIT